MKIYRKKLIKGIEELLFVDGIIIINKEKGWTSNDVVQKIKHMFNEKVGHTGTLDPMATGVLPLLIRKRNSSFKIFNKS